MSAATYSPEDNKLRLYCGRVPRDEYERLRAEGWTSTPKQDCDFVATWTPTRRDTALEYGDGVIDDEDQPLAERSADRAERFSGYRDKRTSEAVGHADNYDSHPGAHGFQSQARAERAAARHDRIADRACDSWSKAEYWQQRTAGVISHALYKSRPDVRMGRIKELEAELRKHRATIAKSQEVFDRWTKISAEQDTEKQNKWAKHFADYCHGDYVNPVTGKTESLYRIAETEGVSGKQIADLWLADSTRWPDEDDWTQHLTLRLAYENQMLEAQGGRAAHVEMIPGGFIGSYQIQRVNKSPVTDRVVSVMVKVRTHGKDRWGNEDPKAPEFRLKQIDTERLPANEYRAPSAEELAAFQADQKETKAKAKIARAATAIPLINPTDEEAERLQAIWNERGKAALEAKNKEDHYKREFVPSTVCRITQEVYSANSKGAYARAETRGLCADAQLRERDSNLYSSEREKRDKAKGKTLCQIRRTSSDSQQWPYVDRVIVLTDKPQKPLPAAVWQPLPPQPELITEEPKTLA